MSQEQLVQKIAPECNFGGKIAVISLGANLMSPIGPPEKTLAAAIAALAGGGGMIRAISRFFATPCFPAGAGPDYVNAALVLKWQGTALALLTLLHQVEAQFARKRQQRWGMRTLDLDLVSFGDLILPDPETQEDWRLLSLDQQMQLAPGHLILPHPRLQDRAFVLVPMMDIAPAWRHPVLLRDTAEILAALPLSDRDAVKPL